MNKDTILAKIESLHRCIQRVEKFRGTGSAHLESSVDSQDIVVLNLERAVQIMVDISGMIITTKDLPMPYTMGEVFLELSKINIISSELADRLKRAVGFRNLAVHQYDKLNWYIVYSVATQGIEDIKEFISSITKEFEL
ncbi:MAG: DUF86 domain-containing protein [Leptospira sp.]|nr:DUF86 domain-containing protein [Leptospira sp.]